MKCERCNNEVSEDLAQCPACGNSVYRNANGQPPVQQVIYVQQSAPAGAKTRLIYILLAIFLGSFGIHNFYAGYTGRGIVQLLLTLGLFWTLVVPIGVFIWVVIDILTITKDKQGAPLA